MVKNMSKTRVKLDICGVTCTLITEESEEYMKKLGAEVSKLMSGILYASPSTTVQLAAVTAALSYLDENKQSLKRIKELEESGSTAHNEEILSLKEQIELLKAENKKLKTEKPAEKIKAKATEYQTSDLKNPMRPDVDEAGLVSFFEIEK